MGERSVLERIHPIGRKLLLALLSFYITLLVLDFVVDTLHPTTRICNSRSFEHDGQLETSVCCVMEEHYSMYVQKAEIWYQ